MMLYRFFTQCSRWQKRVLAGVYDFVAVLISMWLAFYLRLINTIHWADSERWWMWILMGAVVALPIFYFSGLYHLVIRYASHHLVYLCARGVALSALVWGGIMLILRLPEFPRSVIFIYVFIAFTLIAGGRLIAQVLLRRSTGIPVVIYGAGIRGAQLATALQHGPEYHVVAFIDDDPGLAGNQVMNLRVYSVHAFKNLQQRYKIKEILVSIHFNSNKQRNRVLYPFREFPVRVKVLPSIYEVAQKKLSVLEYEEITAADLLGRDAVEPDEALLRSKITHRCVLITGAGGTIGSELCRQVIALEPAKMILLDHSEYALYRIEQHLKRMDCAAGVEIVTVLGSVCNRETVAWIIDNHAVETIYHAAAYKHVPLVEKNVLAGIYNNVFGTWVVAQEAIRGKVGTLILISTDKAVRPTSVMGASKRLAEMIFQSMSVERQQTCFGIVRFGNVLDSSGSVVPLFRQQLRSKGPLTVTHADMTRYFMTQNEAVELVIQAGAMAQYGNIFVLDMGDPVKINDLARMMIYLSGYQVKDKDHPDGDIEIRYTGVRAGEKINEELLISGEVSKTSHPKILQAHDGFVPWQKLQAHLERIDQLCKQGDKSRSVALLKEITQSSTGHPTSNRQ